jgi:hypothetical protein
MIEKSDIDVAKTLTRFSEKQLDVTFLVPTVTGLDKAIMDATASIRMYLDGVGCHDFEAQQQGPEHKKVVKAFFVYPDRLEETTASLYRPQTKSGDPRIWFSKLKTYAEPHNLLAVFYRDDALYVVNCSRGGALECLGKPETPLGRIAQFGETEEANPIAIELLDKLREISARGFVSTLRNGDTGIGYTLETLLGIAANTSRAPDYKGIELKASRKKTGRANRVTLFSQVPNWKLSPADAASLLETYGYEKEGRQQLYHTINAVKPNSIGFMLEVDRGRDWLKQNYVEGGAGRHLTTWEFPKLRKALSKKHPSTFWVKADVENDGAGESFHYVEVVQTRSPRIWSFDTLIEAGSITVDYTLADAGSRVRDHGYLFKIHPTDFHALFPPPKVHDLTI